MLKLVIGLGVTLMLVGFGAAGWQYVQTLPKTEVAAAGVDAEAAPKPEDQDWLISPSGNLVPRETVLGYLAQDRFVERRAIVITQRAPLESLLVEGEKLPEAPYLQVLADIRAPKVASGACAALLEVLARDCALHSARAVEDSVDRATGTAEFRIELVYTLNPGEDALPDLSDRVFDTESVEVSFEAGEEGAGTVPDMIRATAKAAKDACDAQRRTEACRVMRMDLTWQGDGAGASRIVLGALSRLPKGLFPVPPLG